MSGYNMSITGDPPPYCGHTYIGCPCQRPQQAVPVFTTMFPKTPHQCPICSGTGQVDNGFYNRTGPIWSTGSTEAETCRSCSGSGIVWQPA